MAKGSTDGTIAVGIAIDTVGIACKDRGRGSSGSPHWPEEVRFGSPLAPVLPLAERCTKLPAWHRELDFSCTSPSPEFPAG